MAKQQNLTKEQKKEKTLASMSFTTGLAAFIAAYSGAVLQKSGLSKVFTLLTGAMVVLTALKTGDEGVEAPAQDVDE